MSTERMAESLRKSWQDPERRQRWVTHTHSPDAKRKRAQSLRKYYSTHPEKIKERREENKRRAAELMERRMKQALGENPAEALEKLYLEDGLSLPKIGQIVRRAPETIRRWLLVLGINLSPKPKRSPRKDKYQERNLQILGQAHQAGLWELLTEREIFVLNAHYPLEGRVKTYGQISKDLGLKTRQGAHEITKSALEKLRNGLEPIGNIPGINKPAGYEED